MAIVTEFVVKRVLFRVETWVDVTSFSGVIFEVGGVLLEGVVVVTSFNFEELVFMVVVTVDFSVEVEDVLIEVLGVVFSLVKRVVGVVVGGFFCL